jgi:hypothetical protein
MSAPFVLSWRYGKPCPFPDLPISVPGYFLWMIRLSKGRIFLPLALDSMVFVCLLVHFKDKQRNE